MCNICGGVGKVLNDGIWIKCTEDSCDCSETKISKEDNEL